MATYINGYKLEAKIKDDGTNYVAYYGNTKLFGVRKSDNQVLGQAGFSGDQSI